MEPLDVLTLAVLAYVGVRLVDAARQSVSQRSHVWHVLSGMRAVHFLLAIPVLVAVITTAVLLLQVPGLSFGWWTAIGGEGNPVFGTARPSAVGPLDTILPVLFGLLLLLGLPLLVEGEEWIFRRGAERRSRAANLGRAVLFGLVHAVVGVPIAAALALSVGGMYLTWRYLRVWRATGSPRLALLESTRAHLAYNLVIVALVLTALALG
ncbi:MAG: hypothetical protein M3357_05605 [Actinomycetota bacterium]|nr:hypothetical protein [Actinomycetota bacterium]